jgi:hypothetical protein
MNVTRTYRYQGRISDLHEVVGDAALYDQVATRSGALSHTTEISHDAAGTLVVVLRRELPTDQVPSFARGMVGNALVVVETTHWPAAISDGPIAHAEGAFSVVIEGAPVTYTGTVRLEEVGAETTQTIEGELKSSVPLFGKKIEAAVEPLIVHQLDVLAELVGTALAQR